jgi:L-fuconolactonase
MFVVDCQVHIWQANSPERPWRDSNQKPPRPEPLMKEELLREMDKAGVARAIIVPPSMEGDRNDLALDAAHSHPDRFAVMGRIPLDKPELEPEVAAWRNEPGMLGFRLTFKREWAKPFIFEGKADWFWKAAERANVPVMLQVTADTLPGLRKIIMDHPNLKVAFDHLGLVPGAKDAAAFVLLPEILEMAKLPNVSVKVSGIPCYSSEPYPYRNLHDYIKQTYDAYGPERMFWGADLTRLPCTYRQAIMLFTEHMPWLTTADKELIMGRALCKWLDWPVPA